MSETLIHGDKERYGIPEAVVIGRSGAHSTGGSYEQLQRPTSGSRVN